MDSLVKVLCLIFRFHDCVCCLSIMIEEYLVFRGVHLIFKDERLSYVNFVVDSQHLKLLTARA